MIERVAQKVRVAPFVMVGRSSSPASCHDISCVLKIWDTNPRIFPRDGPVPDEARAEDGVRRSQTLQVIPSSAGRSIVHHDSLRHLRPGGNRSGRFADRSIPRSIAVMPRHRACLCDENVTWQPAHHREKSISQIVKTAVFFLALSLAQLAWADADQLCQDARALIGEDNREAFKLMQQAAQEGSADAEGGLGYFYAQGIEVPKDAAKAAEYFKRGAERGSARAQLNYSVLLLSGEGVAKDPPEAIEWLEKASAAGLPEARERLGLALLHGDIIEGVGKDVQRAKSLLETSAASGLPASQNALGVIREEGLCGDGRDEQAAEDWFRRAAAQGDAKARANLGSLLFNTSRENRARRIEGIAWLLLAADAEDPTAERSLMDNAAVIRADEKNEARRLAEKFASSGAP